MSDCLTNAMKPKEPTKICGTCGHYSLIFGVCKQGEEDVRKPFGEEPCKFYKFDGFYPDGSWREAQEALEQRYEQLEQIARNMFIRAFEHNREGPHLGGIYIADFREQLEALGVDIDANAT